MADANSVDANERGTGLGTPGVKDGDPLGWRLLPARFERTLGQYVNNPATQEWRSQHNGVWYDGTADGWEQIKAIGEQIAWKHTFSDGVKRDPGDILIGLGEFLVEQGVFKRVT